MEMTNTAHLKLLRGYEIRHIKGLASGKHLALSKPSTKISFWHTKKNPNSERANSIQSIVETFFAASLTVNSKQFQYESSYIRSHGRFCPSLRKSFLRLIWFSTCAAWFCIKEQVYLLHRRLALPDTLPSLKVFSHTIMSAFLEM